MLYSLLCLISFVTHSCINFLTSFISPKTPSWTSWSKYSETMLRNIEKKILQYVKTAYRGFFVDVGPVVGPADKIWTISMNTQSTNTPLVLLHGLGAGVALWCLNMDALASKRPLFAVDLLGFGRSSRPKFSTNSMEAEQQMIKSIEEWRKEMKLEQFILLGHSMGGFLATSYAISYPERVNHLILADPWGFPKRSQDNTKRDIPLWVKAIGYVVAPLNPLWAVRAAGPLGQWLIDTVRPDLPRKFAPLLKDESLITQYLYQCNAQTPSGESAFHSMMSGFGWAKNPMVDRIDKLNENVPVTLIYGSKSWIDNSAAQILQTKKTESYVKIQSIPAGHHVYADRPDQFNMHVNEACLLADSMSLKLKKSGRLFPEIEGPEIREEQSDENLEQEKKKEMDKTFSSHSSTTADNIS